MAVVWAALALFIAQTVKGVAGFGSALIAMPVLAVVFGPAEGILVMLVSDQITSLWLLKSVWSRVRWVLVGAVVVGALPGQWIGTELLTVLDPRQVARILGVVVLGMGLSFVWQPVRPGRGELEDLPAAPASILGLGAIAGCAMGAMVGLVGAGGPPVVAFFKRFFNDSFHRSQLIAIFQLNGLLVVGLLLAKGIVDPSALKVLPWLVLPVLAGVRLGEVLSTKASPTIFGRLTGLILVVAGAGLLIR